MYVCLLYVYMFKIQHVRRSDNDENVFKASEVVIFQELGVQHSALNFTGDEHEKL